MRDKDCLLFATLKNHFRRADCLIAILAVQSAHGASRGAAASPFVGAVLFGF